MASAVIPSLTMQSEGDAQAYPGHTRAEEALAEHIKPLEAVRAVTAEVTQEPDLTVLLRLITQKAVELVGGGRHHHGKKYLS